MPRDWHIAIDLCGNLVGAAAGRLPPLPQGLLLPDLPPPKSAKRARHRAQATARKDVHRRGAASSGELGAKRPGKTPTGERPERSAAAPCRGWPRRRHAQSRRCADPGRRQGRSRRRAQRQLHHRQPRQRVGHRATTRPVATGRARHFQRGAERPGRASRRRRRSLQGRSVQRSGGGRRADARAGDGRGLGPGVTVTSCR